MKTLYQRHWLIGLFVLIFSISLTANISYAIPQAITDAEGSWGGRFSTPGVSGGGITKAVADANGTVYVAGPFLTAGGQASVGIAAWDGSRWHTLGEGSTTGVVLSLAIAPDGTLYAGGSFTEIRGVQANGLARWDGTAWSAVGSGLDNLVLGQGLDAEGISELLFAPDGTLYAGGLFSSIDGVAVNNVARWDGATWSPMGDGFDSTVLALAADANGNVYAGGRFGDNSSQGFFEKVSRWDGSAWATMIHVTEPIFDIVLDDAGTIYVAGDFLFVDGDIEDTDSGLRVNQFMYSTDGGATWQNTQVGDFIGFQGAPPNASNTSRSQVLGMAFGGDGTLYVAGEFDYVTDVQVQHVAAFKDGVWTALAAGVGDDDTYAWDVASAADGVYFVGTFVRAGDLGNVGRVTRWTGSVWAALGSGLTSPAAGGTVSSFSFDGSGNLYAAGFFNGAGGLTAANAATWDGDRWTPLGAALTTQISRIVVAPDGTIYAGGVFFRSNFTTYNIARWTGTTWEAVGDVTSFAPTAQPNAMAVDSQGRLYVAGLFSMLQGQAVPGGFQPLIVWDGTAWSVVGGGVDIGVDTIMIDDQDRVYIGGPFRTVGGQPASRVAMWDGGLWVPFGPGLNDNVRALALASDGTLFAGGDFMFSLPTEPLNHLAAWDGTAWQPVGTGVNERVAALAFDDQNARLYVGGQFTATTDGQALSYIAAWDTTGQAWSTLGAGVNAEVLALHYTPENGLYVGGNFSEAGGLLSAGLAIWMPSSNTSTAIEPDAAWTQPTAFELEANYPNPFNPTTLVPFELHTPMHVRLTVYDLLGRPVATLHDGALSTGRHEITWDASGHASGLYLYRLEGDSFAAQRTMLLVK